MPNWIRGTLKLRGKRDDIERFFVEGLDASKWTGDDPDNDVTRQVKNHSNKDELYFEFCDEPHIVGSIRAFITDDYAYLNEEYGTVCVDIKQAWDFETDVYKSISNKFNLDVRVYGIECGMEFTHEIIALKGAEIINTTTKFDDWDWECPFPKMGG